MCLACRARDDQSRLIRLAFVDGVVRIDPSRRLPGRGAYVHPVCAELLASRRGVVGRALRASVDPTQVAQALAAASGD
jgi:predicted RNA-binding protein YlxR (DUF448 family)